MTIILPVTGSLNWDVTLNAALTTLDTNVTTITNGAVLIGASASGDLSGTFPGPTVTTTHLSAPLPITQGGTGAATASGARTALGITDTVQFNVKDHGAVGNGIADDTTAVQNTINAASSAGGGTVFFPTGTYLLTPTASPAITVPSNVRLVGEARRATTLKKNVNGILIGMSGPSSDPTGATHVKYSSIENMELNGNNLTGNMIQIYYADNLFFQNVYTVGCFDVCIDTAEFWDSRFINCTWEASGSQTANAVAPNVQLRNSAASSGFGASVDSVNQIHFIGCRWEGFYTGALSVTQGVSNSDNPNGIYITDCKMETSSINGGPHLKADANTTQCIVDGLYCFAGNFAAGYSTATTVINWAASRSALQNVLIANGAVATINLGVDLYISSGNTALLSNIQGSYTTAPTGSHIYLEPSAAGSPNLVSCRSNTGTQFGGNFPPDSLQVMNKAVVGASTELYSALGVQADTNDRFTQDGNGKMQWGPGSSALDVNLYRPSANYLQMDHNFIIGNNEFVSNNLGVGTTTTLGDNGAGELQLANAVTVPTTNPTGGLDLYSQAGVLKSRNPQGLVIIESGLVQSTTSTTTIANTAALSTLETFTVPANDPVAGAVYEMTGYGVYSTTGTPTATFALYWGGTGGTLIAAIPAITTATLTNSPFFFRALVNFRSTTSLTAVINLSFDTSTVTDAVQSYVGTPTAATTVTTTGANALAMGFTWSAASASNTISLLGGDVRRVA